MRAGRRIPGEHLHAAAGGDGGRPGGAGPAGRRARRPGHHGPGRETPARVAVGHRARPGPRRGSTGTGGRLMTAKTASRDITAEITYLTRALKAPTLRDAVPRLAERARQQSWTHEEFLAACLQREVSARESHGGGERSRAARVPARKALEDLDYPHAPHPKHETLQHPG